MRAGARPVVSALELDDFDEPTRHLEPVDEGDPDIEDIPEDTDEIPEQVRRMLYAVARRQARIRAAEQQAAAMKDEALKPIDEWLHRERRRNDTSELEDILTNFHAAWLEKHPKAKTIDGPGASLTSRTSDVWDWQDEAAAVRYFENEGADSLLSVKVGLRKVDVKKAVKVDTDTGEVRFNGEVVPGIVVHGGETVFRVTVPDPEPF